MILKLKKTKRLSNNLNVVIRSAKIEDSENLLQFVREVSDETDFLMRDSQDCLMNVDEEQEFILEKCMKENHLFLIAEIEHEIIGSLGFSGGNSNRTRHKGDMGISVKKKFWKLGVGKFLMTELILWAKQSNLIKKINLTVRKDNIRAIRFYKHFDFKMEGSMSREFYIKGTYYNSSIMGLEIN
jgi:RimJ/RimL family protein N-acetyltransferase